MSIQKEINNFILQCDFCSNYEDGFCDFQEAVDYKKANEWKSKNIKGEWFDQCPDHRRNNK